MNRRKFFTGVALAPVTVAAATAATLKHQGERGYFVTEAGMAEMEKAVEAIIDDIEQGRIQFVEALKTMRADPITESEFDAA